MTAPATALTPQPKLSYLPNPSPLPSLSSFVFPLPSTPWGLSLRPALSPSYWSAELPFNLSPFPLGDTLACLGGRACIDFCVVFTGGNGMSVTRMSASDWIAAETPGTNAKLCTRNGFWVCSLSLGFVPLGNSTPEEPVGLHIPEGKEPQDEEPSAPHLLHPCLPREPKQTSVGSFPSPSLFLCPQL
ncbi:uncharacterized protein LOC129151520 isoform X2 [Eptesicus fuscus]|uniref:uncharacterized protein LOC129151520 isoform X2 n=1 Tax=Eptesicus fuscus TaxID=29078 RepID=UPI0024049083|nr:uncharacterized protein LOC129151520 isoform X2 [Eptesicus fuscus]